jgi:hypothetical protein
LISLVLLCWLVSPLLARKEVRVWPVALSPSRFDGQRAYQIAAEYVTRYPRRVLGSIESRQSTGFFKEFLEPLGYVVQYMHFDTTIAGHREVGRNVLAMKKGQLPETVVVIAHYDTASTTIQGASDDGAGVAVMLELARIFSTESLRRSLLFVASDGEEAGMLGALDLVRNYSDRARLAAAISLDGVAPGDLSGMSLKCVGLDRGYSPPWLRLAASDAAGAEGLSLAGPSGFEEHLDRTFQLPATDAGPFLGAGIPAANLGSLSSDPQRWRTISHSAHDTIDNLKPVSVEKYGRVAERLVTTLAVLPSLPQEPMAAFEIVRGRYLPPQAVALLHLLCFLPFLGAFIFNWRRYSDDFSVELFQRELTAFFGAWIPFLAVYAGIAVSWSLWLLPRFTLYPPPPEDPVMENPSWKLAAAIFCAGALVAVALYFFGKFLTRKVPRAAFHPAKLFLLALLVVVLVLAFTYNSYWTATFLLLPSLIWGLIGPGATIGARAANRILILAAGVPYAFLLIGAARGMGLGWNMIWFQMLAFSTGLFTLIAYCLATAAVALGVRLLAIQSRAPR